MYAVLSGDKDLQGNKWDVEAFFETGVAEIADAIGYLQQIDAMPEANRALDFGCGVGRLSQALCTHFATVVGVDISYSMVECATAHNKFEKRCDYKVNTMDDLSQFEDASFDFVYSNISLQHSPPEAAAKYIAEFFRILRPGGIALFQVPSGKRHEPGSIGAKIYSLKRGPLRRFWKRIRGKPPVEIHYVHQSLVEEIIANSGGKLLHSRQFGSQHRSRVSMQYCAVAL